MNTTPHLTDTAQATPSLMQAGGQVLRVSAFSQTGVSHSVNQDCVSFRSPDAFVVADGVGGGAWGEVASDMLAKGLSALYRPDEQAVDVCMAKLDSDIAAKLKSLGDDAGASVVACLWQLDAATHECLASWVGDCQLSHWKKGDAQWGMSWHSTAQSYETCGLQPPVGVPIHSPANMVGCGMALPVSHHRLVFNTHERMVLSSDGFWRAVTTAQLGQFMNQFAAQLPADAAQQLCAMALKAGSEDDISVLVIEKLTPKPLPVGRSVLTRWLTLAVTGALLCAALGWAWWTAQL